MDLSALADFHRVAAAGSLGKASRQSDRPKATLSRHIRDLEESLGVRLVERGTRALRLTVEGHALFERTRRLLLDIEDAGRHLASADEEPHGPLRITAPILFSDVLGGRLIAEFASRYPRVHVELSATDRYVDLIEEGFDVAIRGNPRPDSDLVGRRFAKSGLLVVASPSVTLPAPDDQDNPPVVPAVASGRSLLDPALWRLTIGDVERKLSPDYRVRMSSLTSSRAAVLAGAGAAILPDLLVRNDIREGRLVLWGRYDAVPVDFWVLHTSRRLANRTVSAFVRFVAESFPTREL